ncbi:MAG: acyl-CoA synthetase FdrA [Alphaproteobacteria bacterium]|nr:acyl-CoA synthetase FdrA [Alphaproteobacteria bacterium]
MPPSSTNLTANRVRRGFYLDSVALMRLSQTVSALPGVTTAALMIGSASNRGILHEAGLLTPGCDAGANDLIIAVQAATQAQLDAAVNRAEELLDQPQAGAVAGSTRRPRTISAALTDLGGANLALVSVPGEFAAGEAHRALGLGLHVLIFSDNVSYEEERALKEEAQKRGLLVMGPDCGTALIGGVPLAFANEVALGDIGIVGASGTGLQEVSTLIARGGGGVSHGIGTGGRDLSEKIGALTTLAAIDALDADPGTKRIVLISKPPAANVAEAVLARVARSKKPFVICFLGAKGLKLPANARFASTLAAAASAALDKPVTGSLDVHSTAAQARAGFDGQRRWIRGVYTGGTLCGEAQIVLRDTGEPYWSNAPIPGSLPQQSAVAHSLVDYGADEYTRGRPHPMIDPALRDQALATALGDPAVAAVLFDCVIGHGAHADPAGAVARVIKAGPGNRPALVASVTGTDADPQNRATQVRTLQEVGVLVAASNAEAASLALAISRPR